MDFVVSRWLSAVMGLCFDGSANWQYRPIFSPAMFRSKVEIMMHVLLVSAHSFCLESNLGDLNCNRLVSLGELRLSTCS